MNVRRPWLRSLRRQLIFAVAGVHALLMTLFVWDVTHRQRALLMELQAEQAEAVAQSMATSSAGWLSANDVSGLQEIVDAQRRHAHLAYAMLLDRQGRVLAHTDRTRLGLYVRDLPARRDTVRISYSPPLLDVIVPARMEGRFVGWVRVGFGQNGLSARLAELTRAGLLYALAAIVIGILLASLLGTRVTARLHAIRRVSQAVRAGHRENRVPDLGADEVALLGRDFNEMLDSLSRREAEQLAAEEALRASERHEQATFELAAMGIGEVAPDGRWLRVNRRLTEILGRSREELLEGGTFQRITHPDDLEEDLGQVRRCLAGEFDSYAIEKRYLGVNGDVIWANLTAALVRHPDGTPDYFISVIEEIGARKRAEQALQASQQRVRLLLDSTAEGLFGVNEQGECIFVNRAGLRLLGYDREEELLGTDIHARIHHTRTDGTPQPAEECRLQAAARGDSGSHVTDELFWRRDGVPFPVEYWAYPMHQGGRIVGVVTTFSDRTEAQRAAAERESLESQLRQAQKMEAVGQLAGGVAHDFNNILTAILGNTSLMRLSGPLTADQSECLDQIHTAGERAAAITKHLLTFSRRQRFECREIDLNQVVLGLRSLLGRLLGEAVEFRLALARQPMTVWADSGMLEQVLVNLGVNARDAMGSGGHFSIGTGTVQLPPGAGPAHRRDTPGNVVRLTVSDSGCGVSPEHLPRIFEPFFTTKEVGKGTGLGLSIVHGILEQHDGWIEVESRVGAGTTFHLYFPEFSGPPATAAEPETGRAAVPELHGDEAILLAEDDEGVRRLARATLEHAGYRVFEAPDGPAALEAHGRHRDEIRLVVMDMVMPGGLTGSRLAEKIRVLDRDLPILFCSGYSQESLDREALPKHRSAFLAKPYEQSGLLAHVRELLDAG